MDIKYYLDDNPSIPEFVMKEMRERLGGDEDDTSLDEKILSLSPRDFLQEWLNWNGLFAYADFIIEALYMAYGISLEDYPFEREIKREVDKW